MDLYEAIEKRRTIRKFKGPATAEQLTRIIAAGTKAPSPHNRQSWEFIVVDDPALIEKIAAIKFKLNLGYTVPHVERYMFPEQIEASDGPAQRGSFANASLIMVCHRKKGRFEGASAWTCITTMLLAAAAEGLGSRIACFWGDAVKEINRLLHIPSEYRMAAAVSIGVAGEEPVRKVFRSEGSWLHRNRF